MSLQYQTRPSLFPCGHSLMNSSPTSFCSHQDYPSLMMWNGPGIWYAPALTNPSETSWDQMYVKFMSSWMSYISISSWLSTHNIHPLPNNALVFCTHLLLRFWNPFDPIGVTCTVMNKTSRRSRAHLLEVFHWNLVILFTKIQSFHPLGTWHQEKPGWAAWDMVPNPLSCFMHSYLRSAALQVQFNVNLAFLKY